MFRNRYYTIALIGLVANVLLQLAVDPYLALVLSPFYPVWFILLVVGWRKEHPRR